MEKLRLVLKKALAEGASQAMLRVGEEGTMILQAGRKVPLTEFGVVEQAWIEGLYKALFPREGLALRSEQLVRSQFNIVNVGKVNVIADPRAPKTLHLFFPPKGELLSQEFWNSLVGSTKPGETHATPGRQASEGTKIGAATGLTSGPGASTISNAVKAETTTIKSPGDLTTSFQALVPIPDPVIENRSNLALILSNDSYIMAKAKAVLEGMKFFSFSLDDRLLFNSIMDRLNPQMIYIDETVPNFQGILKKLYDLSTEKRVQMTIILLSKTYKSSDTKVAFAFSVDAIANREDLEDLKNLTTKTHNSRIATFQSWLDLSTKV